MIRTLEREKMAEDPDEATCRIMDFLQPCPQAPAGCRSSGFGHLQRLLGLVQKGMLACLSMTFSNEPITCSAQSYQVEGNLNLEHLFADGTTFLTNHHRFRVSVERSRWLIEQFPDDVPGACFLTGHDGTNVYSVFVDPRSEAGFAGDLSPGGFPIDSQPYTVIPWLAFASSGHLDSNSNNLPAAPWTLARAVPFAPMFRADIKRSASEPRLPSSVRFYFSDRLKEQVAKDLSGVLASVNRKNYIEGGSKVAFTNGFLTAEFVALSTTNFEGAELPTEFEMIVNAPGFKSFAQRYRGKVDKISRPVRVSYLPKLPKQCFVRDWRFREGSLEVDGIRYWITNSWPAATNAEMVALFEKKKDEARKNLRPPGFLRSGRLALAFLGVLILLPPVLLGMRWQRKQTKQQQ